MALVCLPRAAIRLPPGVLLCAVVLTSLLAGQAAADMPSKLLERIKEQTVMITVTHRDQSVVHGAGVALCQQDGQAYVLTAYPLLASELPGGRSVLRRPTRLEIDFYRDGLPAIVDERASGESVVTLRQVPEQEAVLLTFPLAQDLETAAESLGWRNVTPLLTARGTPAVRSLGYRDATEQSWADEEGILLPGDALLRHTGTIPPGFSGGPLYTESGVLLGVNLRPVHAEEGEALSILEVLAAIGKWLPLDCLRRLDMKAHPVLDSRDRWDAARALVDDERTADPERLKELAAMITVTSEDASNRQGAGVVLCQDGGTTYVLTARHVLADASARTEVRLYHHPLLPAADVTWREVPGEDLALLSFPFAEKLELTAFLGPPSESNKGKEVVAVGFPKSSATTWATERGTLLDDQGESVRHSAAVAAGFSGGPLLDAGSGALVGVNVERDVKSSAGEALSVDHVMPKVAPSLPEGCLRAREAQVSGLFQGVWAEAYSHVPLTLTAEAEELVVWGKKDDFHIGDHEVTVDERKTGSFLRKRTKETFRFTLAEDRGAVWNGDCTRTFDSSIDLGLLEEVFDQRSKLTCRVDRKDGEAILELEMEEHSAATEESTGFVKASDFRLDVAESKPLTSKTLGLVVPAGYFFYADDRIVGAVDTLVTDRVYLHPALAGEARSAFLATAAALLLTHDEE